MRASRLLLVVALAIASRPARRSRSPCRSSRRRGFPEFIAAGRAAGAGADTRGLRATTAPGASCRPAIFANAEREVAACTADVADVLSARSGAAATSSWRGRSRGRRWRTSIGRSPSAATTCRRSSAAGRRCSALDRERRRDCRVRTRARRRPVADRRPPARRGAAGSAALERDLAAARQAAQRGPERRGDSAVSGGDRELARQRLSLSRAGAVERRTRRQPTRRSSISAAPRARSDRTPARSARSASCSRRGASMPRRFAAYDEALALEPSAALSRRAGRAARTDRAGARCPAEYRAIASAPQITRGDLAALIGVRLGPAADRPAARRRSSSPTCAAHWAEHVDHDGRAGRRDGSRSPTTRFSRGTVVAAPISPRRSTRLLARPARLSERIRHVARPPRVRFSDVRPTATWRIRPRRRRSRPA